MRNSAPTPLRAVPRIAIAELSGVVRDVFELLVLVEKKQKFTYWTRDKAGWAGFAVADGWL